MRRVLIPVAGLAALLAIAASGGAQTSAPPSPDPAKPAAVGPNFVDEDGDGVCDRCASRPADQARRGRGPGSGRGGYGPGDGTGNQGVGPRDGSGYGPGPGANCDGTGPKGKGRRGGRR